MAEQPTTKPDDPPPTTRPETIPWADPASPPIPPPHHEGGYSGRRLRDYLVLGRIGRGGMGQVYKARHVRLDRLVAIKVLPLERFADAAAISRFEREMKAVGRLDHPNIVLARDAGEADGVHFLVMELLEGFDLAAILKERGPRPLADACEVIRQAALGLQHAHEAGRVHRDLKPSNLFLTRAGTVKVLDLGLALIVEETIAGPLTPADAAMGTFDYTAPEQWADAHRVDIRADLYSLGCTLFALLTGGPPFPADSHPTLTSKMMAHLHESPPPLREFRAEVPPDLEALVARLLAKAPDDRFQTPGELAGALAPFCIGADLLRVFEVEPDRTGPPGPAPEPTPVIEVSPDAPPEAGPGAIVDEDVQFTVYRPRVVAPLRWAPMLAFAHLASKPIDAPADAPEPTEEVARQAEQVLGAEVARAYQQTTQDTGAAVPRDEILTLVPLLDGVEFNPPRRQFRWTEMVHREEFRLRASAALDGKTARGRLSVYLGSILLAEVSLSLRVDSRHVAPAEAPPATESSTAGRFRKIYASFAAEDRPIADQFGRFARALGDEYLSRCTALRAGDSWDDRIREAIDGADVFQLFWSRNAIRSDLVEREWRHALALGRPRFLRPVYWEDPLPTDPARDLPPETLRRLHFERLDGIAPIVAPPRPETNVLEDTDFEVDVIGEASSGGPGISLEAGSDFDIDDVEADPGTSGDPDSGFDLQPATSGEGGAAASGSDSGFGLTLDGSSPGSAEVAPIREDVPAPPAPGDAPSARIPNSGGSDRVAKYTIEEPLGRGGFGQTYRGRDSETGQPVYLRVQPAREGDRDFQAGRIRREAELHRRLEHPNIVRALGGGVSEGRAYLALEYVDGGSLAAVIRDVGPLPWRDAAELAIQACEALQFAHERGVVHGNLKPSNLLINRRGRLKLAGFGLIPTAVDPGGSTAPFGPPGDPFRTSSGAIAGTPMYMAPEQIRGTAVIGPKADLYALGVLLYQMLAGRPPFAGTSAMVLLHRHLTEPPPRASEQVRGLPRPLDDLIAGLLTKSAADRPRDAAAVAQALRSLLGRAAAGQAVEMSMPRPIPPASLPPDWRSRTKSKAPSPRGRGADRLRLLVGVAVLIALGLAAYWLL